MGKRVLYLIRHGEMDRQAFAVKKYAAGLTARGREQARCVAKRLAGLEVRAIHASSAGRALETAAIIATQYPTVPVRHSRLLWELPNLDFARDPERRHVFEEHLARAGRAFGTYVQPTRQRHRTEIIVSHGNLIRHFACCVLGLSPDAWPRLGTSHAAISQIVVSGDGRLQLVAYNDVGHPPARLRV